MNYYNSTNFPAHFSDGLRQPTVAQGGINRAGSNLAENIGKSSLVTKLKIFTISCFVSKQDGVSKTSGVESRCQILDFLSPV